jgi:hypothetical protein
MHCENSPCLRVKRLSHPLGMKKRKAGWTTLAVVAFLTACSTSGVTAIPVNSIPGTVSDPTVPVGIPREYIPAPGKCRIWHPDRSPEQQPAPERCLEIFDVPPGALVVYGGAMIKTYRVEVFDPHRAGVVNAINYFELESGRFLRQEKICDQVSP